MKRELCRDQLVAEITKTVNAEVVSIDCSQHKNWTKVKKTLTATTKGRYITDRLKNLATSTKSDYFCLVLNELDELVPNKMKKQGIQRVAYLSRLLKEARRLHESSYA